MSSKVKVIDLSDLAKEVKDKGLGKRSMADMLEKIMGDSVPSNVRDAIGRIIDGEAAEAKVCGSQLESQAELAEYYQNEMPKVGQFVERNRFGFELYEMKDTEAAMVVDVWPDYRPEGEVAEGVTKMANGVVAFCGRVGIVRVHPVDLRMFKVVTVEKTGTSH